MKNRKTIIIVAIIAVLAIAVAIFAFLNSGNLKEKQQSQQNATVKIVQGDKTVEFDLVYLKGLKKTVFSADLAKNNTSPVKTSFTGVPLITVLKDKGFNLDNVKQVIFTAADGYASVINAQEASDTDNVYLVYERNGKASGTKDQGGSGPIEMVVKNDQFSQRWCKFLMEIELK